MKRWMSLALVLCMVLALCPALPVAAATWNAVYTEDSLQNDYSGDVAGFRPEAGWMFQETVWGGKASVVYEGKQWSDFSYSVCIDNAGSTPGGKTMLYFCYQSSNNHYVLTFGNDAATGITLTKVVGGKATDIPLSLPDGFVKMKQHTVTVRHTAEGGISATYHAKGTTDEKVLFEEVTDTSFEYGKVGFGFEKDGGRFGNIAVTGTEYQDDTEPDVGDGEWGALGNQSLPLNVPNDGTLPEGIVSNGIASAKNDDGTYWGAFAHSVWGGSGTAVYDDLKWEQELTYKLRINNYSSDTTTYLYFMYTDENNYYALALNAAEVKLITKVGGVETSVASAEKISSSTEYVVTVQYIDGNISATAEKGGAAITLFESVADAAHTSGKIGLGFKGGGFHANNVYATGLARKKVQPEEEQAPFVLKHRMGDRVAYFADVTNDTGADITAAVALYETETGMLAGFDAQTVSGETAALSGEFAIQPNTDYYAKLFRWESLDSIRPVADVLTAEYDRNTYKVLAIGNSFSQDAMAHLSAIARADGVKMTAGNMYIGGCSIDTHWANAQGDLANYDYEVNGSKAEYGVTLKQALQKEDWDFVTLQQASPNSGQASTYKNIGNLAGYVREIAPRAEVVVHQTWAYEKGSTHSGFANYQNDQVTMFNAIKEANDQAAKLVSQAINQPVVAVIPGGEAFQNARNGEIDGVKVFDTTYAGGGANDTNVLNRDGYHASQSYGRYLLGMVWYEALTGNPVADNTYRPSATKPTDDQVALLKQAAHRAVADYGLIQ